MINSTSIKMSRGMVKKGGKEKTDIQYFKFTVSNPKLGVVTSDYTKQLAEKKMNKAHFPHMQPESGRLDTLF